MPQVLVEEPTDAGIKRMANRRWARPLLVAIVSCHATVIIGTETASLPCRYIHITDHVGAGNIHIYSYGRPPWIKNADRTYIADTKCVRGIGCKLDGDRTVITIASTTHGANIYGVENITAKVHGAIGGCLYHIRTVVIIQAGPIGYRNIARRFRGE